MGIIQSQSLAAAAVQYSRFTACAAVEEERVVEESLTNPKAECPADYEPTRVRDTASSLKPHKPVLQPTSEEKTHPQQEQLAISTCSNNNNCGGEKSKPDDNESAIGNDDSGSLLNQDDVPKAENEGARKKKRKNTVIRCERCELVPHPTLIHCCVCVHCKAEPENTPTHLLYSQERKMYNQRHDLVKVVARLDQDSQNLIDSIRTEFHIERSVDHNHIVLACSLTRVKATEMVSRLL
jgi:predicted transposase YbfD/YdcC